MTSQGQTRIGGLAQTGLSWLADVQVTNGPCITLRPLPPGGAVQWPFVPEFAHDLQRGKLFIEGRFDEILPIAGGFVPDLNCPNRCEHCAFKKQKVMLGAWPVNDLRNPDWHMPVRKAQELVSKLADVGLRYLVITGGGEPLLNLRAVLSVIRAAGEAGILVGIYTNGRLLTDKVIGQILAARNVLFVRVSCNAGSAQLYEAFHSPLHAAGAFEKLKDGIERLAKRRAQEASTTELGLSYLVSPLNLADAKPFAQWAAGVAGQYRHRRSSSGTSGGGPPPQAQRAGIDFCRFTPMIRYYEAEELPSAAFLQAAGERLDQEVVPILDAAGVRTVAFQHRFAHDEKPYEECLAAALFAELWSDGNLYHCCQHSGMPGYCLGDPVAEASGLRGIWRGPRRRQILERLKRGRLRDCPVYCKPDRMNRIAQKIRQMRWQGTNVAALPGWLEDLHNLRKRPDDAFFLQPKIVGI